MADKVSKTDEQWREQLTPEQFRIAREGGTEPAFTGAYYETKTPGIYRCVGCQSVLFTSKSKFDSGSGWPSFVKPADLDTVETHTDSSLGMRRTEVRCGSCQAHLGHVFPDGPPDKGGMRYCINSAVLQLDEMPPEEVPD